MVTQTDEDDLGEPLVQQQHKPLAFVERKYTGAQESWKAYEKEADNII